MILMVTQKKDDQKNPFSRAGQWKRARGVGVAPPGGNVSCRIAGLSWLTADVLNKRGGGVGCWGTRTARRKKADGEAGRGRLHRSHTQESQAQRSWSLQVFQDARSLDIYLHSLPLLSRSCVELKFDLNKAPTSLFFPNKRGKYLSFPHYLLPPGAVKDSCLASFKNTPGLHHSPIKKTNTYTHTPS